MPAVGSDGFPTVAIIVQLLSVLPSELPALKVLTAAEVSVGLVARIKPARAATPATTVLNRFTAGIPVAFIESPFTEPRSGFEVFPTPPVRNCVCNYRAARIQAACGSDRLLGGDVI